MASPIVEGALQTDQDIEGRMRALEVPGAVAASALGAVIGVKLLTVETRSSIVNGASKLLGAGALYLGFKAGERATELAIPKISKTFQEAVIGSYL